MRHLCSILFALTLFNAYSQKLYRNIEWHEAHGSVSTYQKLKSVRDGNGFVLVLTTVYNAYNNSDVMITKLDGDGSQIWQYQYNNSNNDNDIAIDIEINQNNEIFVGFVKENAGTSSFGLLKLSETGSLLFESDWSYSTNDHNICSDITIDDVGNTYMVGGTSTNNSFSDFAIIQVDASGTFGWEQTYDNNSFHDAATVALVEGNDLIVTGAAATSVSNFEIATLNMDCSNGAINDTQISSTQGIGIDGVNGIKADGNNNIYLIGHEEINSNKNLKLIKLDSYLNIIWSKSYDNGGEDIGVDIELDNQGNIYVLGNSANGVNGTDFLLKKYDNSGNDVWTIRTGSESSSNINCSASDLAINDTGELVFVGTQNDGSNSHFYTSKYDQAGDCKFIDKFSRNEPTNIASSVVTIGDEIYVSGISELNSIEENITVKYRLIEKVVNYITDLSGNPVFEENDLLVRLDTSALIKAAIDKVDFSAGKIEDFVKSTQVSQIKSAIYKSCGEGCDINAYKIFHALTTSDTLTTSRLGEDIRVPHFWATLILEFPPGVDVTVIKSELEGLFPLVKFADLNPAIELYASANDTEYGTSQASLHPTASFPNAHINIEPAWDFESGESFVRVGVFDTGILWGHEEFGNGTTTTTKVQGWDFNYSANGIDLHTSPTPDVAGHGTKCAGIIGGARNNATGIAGIAGGNNNAVYNVDSMGVSLYSLNIIDATIVNDFQTVANAIVTTSIDNLSLNYGYGLNIQNHSWGIDNTFAYYADSNIRLLREAVHFANRQKVVVASARGNEGNSDDTYPSNLDDDWVLCVGGTGTDGQFIQNSVNGGFTASSGWDIDVAGPAALQINYTTSNISSNSYSSFNGTSAATPHAAGVAALLMSYLDNPFPSNGNLAPEDVEQILQLSALDTDLPGVDSLTGYGLIDAGQAFDLVDKSKNYVLHFGTDNTPFTNVVDLYNTGITVQLTERFENNMGQWFLPNTDYIVDVYRVRSYVDHNLSAQDSIISFWPRPSSSIGFDYLMPAGPTSYVEPRERIGYLGVTKPQATLYTYVYKAYDTLNNFLGWWPADTSQVIQTYTVLMHNPAIAGLNDLENDGSTINVYPNPVSNNQTLKINLTSSNKASIGLYDITGKLVLDIFDGILKEGESKFIIPLANLPKGMYIYNFEINDKSYHTKIIKE